MLCFTLCFTTALVACGGAQTAPECQEPDHLEVLLRPSAQLNPDREGHPRSVVVHVLQLDGEEALHGVTARSYWGGPQGEALGSGVLGDAEEAIAVPGRPALHRVELAPKATHVAILANFREPPPAWKTTLRLPTGRNPCDDDVPVMRAHVDLSENRVQGALRLLGRD